MKNYKQLRYTDEELSLINNAFAESEDTLLLIRKFLLQGELTATEKGGLKFLTTQPELLKILKKTYLPEIDFEAPIGQILDNWSLVNTKDREPEMFEIEMEARQIIIDYFTERFDLLMGIKNKKEIKFTDLIPKKGKTGHQALVELTARNMILGGVESNTAQLWILAGQKKESPEEIKKRLFKDSSK